MNGRFQKVLTMALAVLLLGGCGRTAPETQPETLPPQSASTETAATTAPTQAQTAETEPEETEPQEAEPQEERFVLTFAGDCTLGSTVSLVYADCGFSRTVGEDYGYPFRNVVSYFENDDLTLVNLEGVLGDKGGAASKTFTFRGPREYVKILTGSSVEAVTLANNHSADYGLAGYNETKAILDEAGVFYVEKDLTRLITTDSGLTVGLCAATFTWKKDVLAQQIRELREAGAEIVIFAVHWGAEGSYRPIAHQEDQAHAAIDAGADIVFGTHPHVLQPVERYGDGIIFYSLANFCFGGHAYPQDYDTAVVQQEVIRWPDGSVELGELTIIPASVSSITQYNNYQPTPYEPGSKEFERAMSKLDGTYTGPNLRVSY